MTSISGIQHRAMVVMSLYADSSKISAFCELSLNVKAFWENLSPWASLLMRP